MEPKGIASFENVVGIRSGAAIRLVDRNSRAKTLRVAIGVRHVILVREHNVGSPPCSSSAATTCFVHRGASTVAMPPGRRIKNEWAP